MEIAYLDGLARCLCTVQCAPANADTGKRWKPGRSHHLDSKSQHWLSESFICDRLRARAEILRARLGVNLGLTGKLSQ